jgi:hypothetical protein
MSPPRKKFQHFSISAFQLFSISAFQLLPPVPRKIRLAHAPPPALPAPPFRLHPHRRAQPVPQLRQIPLVARPAVPLRQKPAAHILLQLLDLRRQLRRIIRPVNLHPLLRRHTPRPVSNPHPAKIHARPAFPLIPAPPVLAYLPTPATTMKPSPPPPLAAAAWIRAELRRYRQNIRAFRALPPAHQISHILLGLFQIALAIALVLIITAALGLDPL